jgi:capsular exopolysaccharide synthesis family protein
VLIKRVMLGDALQTWGRNRLTVLPAGTVPPNPSELLGSRAMVSLLQELESDFDVIILDAPPLLPVTDAAVLSKIVKGSLVIAAAGRTDRGELTAALAVLENVGAKVSGIVLTFLPVKGAYGYGYGGYGYAPNTPATTRGQSKKRRRRVEASA